MLPCKEIVRLISSDAELSFLNKAELRMHLMMCKHCSRYSKHLQMLTAGFKKLLTIETTTDPSQVERLEKEVIEEIEKKRSGS